MHSDPLSAAIAEAEALVAAAPFIETETDLAEGLQYLAQGVAASVHAAFHHDRDHPMLLSGAGPFTKQGLDNPDTLYFGAAVRPGHDYLVTGVRGTTTDLSFQLIGGEYTESQVPPSAVAFDDRELEIGADGGFSWRFRPQVPAQLVIREVYNDWAAQRGTVTISRCDTVGTAPPPPDLALIEKRYAAAGRALVNRVKTWLAFPQWFYLNLPVNTMTPPRLTPGGLATQYSSAGHYELGDDQALVITLPAGDAPYLGFQLGSRWYISLDYVNHQTSLNGTQAQVDPDGMIRIVVAEHDPGVANWVQTLGHRRGILQFRWQRLSRELTAADGPQVQPTDLDAVPGLLPYFDHNTIGADDWRARIALRQRQIANRMLG